MAFVGAALDVARSRNQLVFHLGQAVDAVLDVGQVFLMADALGIQAERPIDRARAIDLSPGGFVHLRLGMQGFYLRFLRADLLAQRMAVVMVQEVLFGVHLVEQRALAVVQVSKIAPVSRRMFRALACPFVIVRGHIDKRTTLQAALVRLDVGFVEQQQHGDVHR